MPTDDQPPTTNDFDAYLSLLTKLLRLTRGQQAEITAELRDHLDERLSELLSQGHPRESAMRLALEELGDAAVLAAEFTLPHQARRRRQLMRYSMLSGTAIVATFVMAALYWPAARQEPRMQAVAQQDRDVTFAPSATAEKPSQPTSVVDELRQKIEEKLARRDVEFSFTDTPLSDVAEFFGNELELDILLDQRVLQDQGVDPTVPVSLKVRQGALSARAALEILLSQVNAELTFAIRDGVLMITSADQDYANEVYDCRDLIAGVTVQTGTPQGGGGGFGGGGGGVGGGMFQITPEVLGQAGGISGAQPGGTSGGGFCPQTATSHAGQALIEVIQQAVDQDSWSSVGGTGTITEYDGLLIIHHSQRTHRKIEDLLAKMRKVRAAAAKAEIRGTTQNKLDDSAPVIANQPTLTISAVLELDGADPKSIRPGTEVWLGVETPLNRGEKIDWVAKHFAHIKRAEGPGDQPGTLKVLIEGQPSDLARSQKMAGDGLITVRVKLPNHLPLREQLSQREISALGRLGK